MSDKYEDFLNSSRENTFDKCTSIKGICVPNSASRSAMLVWVNAPGLISINIGKPIYTQGKTIDDLIYETENIFFNNL